ncbi:MAG: hypothetical protein AAF721_06815 [Myxococcota bacterium]
MKPRSFSMTHAPSTPVRIRLATLLAACLASVVGCDAQDGVARTADAETTPTSTFRAGELDEFDDVVADFLRDKVDDDLQFDMDYLGMLKAVSEAQGCDESTIDSYVIADALVADQNFPRIVNTVCSDDRRKADGAFFALSFPNADASDVDPRMVEMFAWDKGERRYVFYKTEPVGGGDRVQLTIEPTECADCHLTPENVPNDHTPMMPIMNELTAPWEHWFAAPISVSHTVPEAVKNAPVYKELAGDESPFLKSAARLEQTIRTAWGQRNATARLRLRRAKPADVAVGMSLLRPLMCEEQLSYVTEDGSSGLLSADAAVDGGFHSAYFSIQGVGWPWEWWNDRIMRLPTVGQGRENPDPINMMPVRGTAMVTYERQLLGARGLKAMQVMQLRAIDWHTPVLSELRCDLFLRANDRITSGEVEIEVPEGARTRDLFPQLLAEILTVHPADFGLEGDLPESVRIDSGDPNKVISLARATDLRDLVQAIEAGTLDAGGCKADGRGVCVVEARPMGEMIEVWFKGIENGGREALHRLRDRRACLASRHFANKPFIPDVPSDEKCDALIADPGPG